MRYLKYSLIIALFILPNLMFSMSKGQVLSEERYFGWNDSTSAWVTTERHDYELDSLGMITRKVVYNGSGSIIRVWNCSYTDTTYSLYYSDGGWSGKIYWTLYVCETYYLNGLKLSYINNYDWSDPVGGGFYHYRDDYYYANNKLIELSETYNDGLNYVRYLTVFSYDAEGKILSELKQWLYGENSINLERTLWTWVGYDGTGVNEIYKNTVWIHKALKERTVDTSLKTTSEYRDYWSWGFWINDVHDRDYYNSYGKISTIYTDKYNSATSLYENDKLHAFYYEIFGELTAPSNITSTTSDSSITLSWNAVDGATGYKIYSSADPYGEFTLDTSGTFNGTEWTALVSENKKFYKVTAISGGK